MSIYKGWKERKRVLDTPTSGQLHTCTYKPHPLPVLTTFDLLVTDLAGFRWPYSFWVIPESHTQLFYKTWSCIRLISSRLPCCKMPSCVTAWWRLQSSRQKLRSARSHELSMNIYCWLFTSDTQKEISESVFTQRMVLLCLMSRQCSRLTEHSCTTVRVNSCIWQHSLTWTCIPPGIQLPLQLRVYIQRFVCNYMIR